MGYNFSVCVANLNVALSECHFSKTSEQEVFVLDKKDIISVKNNNFPEYEDIRKAILEAKEKVVTTVNEDTAGNKEEFEVMKRKMKTTIIVSVVSIIALVIGAVVYKNTR